MAGTVECFYVRNSNDQQSLRLVGRCRRRRQTQDLAKYGFLRSQSCCTTADCADSEEGVLRAGEVKILKCWKLLITSLRRRQIPSRLGKQKRAQI